MVIVCDAKLEELKEAEPSAAPISRFDPAETTRINDMLAPKSLNELMELQEQVRSKLASGEPLDVEYWERVLKAIVVWKAKAKLRDIHEVVLTNRIEYLQSKQRDEAYKQQQYLLSQLGSESTKVPTEQDEEEDHLIATDSQAVRQESETARLEALYDAEEMEPKLHDVESLAHEDRNLPITTIKEDLRKLVEARRKVVGAAFVPRQRESYPPGRTHGEQGDIDLSSAMYQQEANKALDVEEEVFNQDEDLVRQTYQWEDKYRPRKPRYFNRVHTGYEWNKYNQTHYDTDNPPPKVVQGYKFNIFYPDLIDKTVAPTYKIIKEPGDPDTVLLRFSAGPPYEDIAFRIVNKEWEYSHRRGFRSSFDRGVLQLHCKPIIACVTISDTDQAFLHLPCVLLFLLVNFKRLRYRK